jgi:hypothetical protein
MTGLMTTRSRLATERMIISATRVETRAKRSAVRFVALEGPMLVVIEADSEDDARSLCVEMGLEFVCLCD